MVKWLEATYFQIKIVVAGNHNACLDSKSHRSSEEEAAAPTGLLRSSPTIHYLGHGSKPLRLQHEDGTEVRIKVFGSPYIPGRRARVFGYTAENAAELWDKIPLDTDIVVAHTPAKYHLDESPDIGSVRCHQLREALWRVRPKLFVCGHIHEGRGVQIVEWDLNLPNFRYKEHSTRVIANKTGASKKYFRVDLSSKSAQPLRNDGSQVI